MAKSMHTHNELCVNHFDNHLLGYKKNIGHKEAIFYDPIQARDFASQASFKVELDSRMTL